MISKLTANKLLRNKTLISTVIQVLPTTPSMRSLHPLTNYAYIYPIPAFRVNSPKPPLSQHHKPIRTSPKILNPDYCSSNIKNSSLSSRET